VTRRKRVRQKGRRALDYKGMLSLHGEVLRVRAYTSLEAADQGIQATREDGEAGRVMVFDVEFVSELPVSPTETATGLTTRFITSDEQYPVSPPVAVVISRHKPLCVHVAANGLLCSGQLWQECAGNEILPEFVLRVMRAYNFEGEANDEQGHQPAAQWFGREHLQGRPFNPNLVLPVVPESVFRTGEPVNAAARPRLVIVSAGSAVAQAPVHNIAERRPRLVVLSGRAP
jgi:hypothetical protein